MAPDHSLKIYTSKLFAMFLIPSDKVFDLICGLFALFIHLLVVNVLGHRVWQLTLIVRMYRFSFYVDLKYILIRKYIANYV